MALAPFWADASRYRWEFGSQRRLRAFAGRCSLKRFFFFDPLSARPLSNGVHFHNFPASLRFCDAPKPCWAWWISCRVSLLLDHNSLFTRSKLLTGTVFMVNVSQKSDQTSATSPYALMSAARVSAAFDAICRASIGVDCRALL